MKIVRIVSDTPSDAADLISFLEGHGFTVQNAQAVHPGAALPDFEIDLRVLPVNAALQLAREMAFSGVDIFVGTDVLPETPPAVVAAAPLEAIEVAPEIEPVAMEPDRIEPFETEPTSIEWIENDALLVEAGAATSAPEPPADPFPVVAVARLRESVVQMLREARLTSRECLALCSAELLNVFEQTRQSLLQARVLLIRKRTLIEARAVRARSIMENRLRFDSSSQNAWIRSAFAGAGLMVVLIALMLWNDQRITTATAAGHGVSAKSTVKASPVLPTTAVSVPVSAALHRQLSSGRTITDDQEVVIRHYGRRVPKTTAAIDTKSGIKHISDMD